MQTYLLTCLVLVLGPLFPRLLRRLKNGLACLVVQVLWEVKGLVLVLPTIFSVLAVQGFDAESDSVVVV